MHPLGASRVGSEVVSGAAQCKLRTLEARVVCSKKPWCLCHRFGRFAVVLRVINHLLTLEFGM
eukprot:14928256-Alexandrium_andersonii.AAC.1